MPELTVQSPLQYVKGVGPRRAAALEKVGLRTVKDLLFYFPRQYLDRTTISTIDKLQIDQDVTIIGEVRAHGMLYGGKRRYEVILSDATGNIQLLWFAGVRYFERLFQKGQIYAVTGRVSYFQGMQIVHPDLERLDDNADQLVHAGRIIPVYPQTAELTKAGLSSKGLRKVTTFVTDNLSDTFPEHLPKAVREAFSLTGYHEAIVKTHYPDTRGQIELCRRRLAFEELLQIQFMVVQNKGVKAATIKKHRFGEPGQRLTEFRKRLSFELTADQKKAVREIFADLQGERPMSRLLHGDVGCGKTVVAVIAALYAADNGLQTALMAPTEILAEQHFRSWGGLLEQVGVRSELLMGSMTAAQRKKIGQRCAEGEIDILFGTHALIYDYVEFKKLGLVIIDEQHRFGVEQRGKLYAKGEDPDLLVMTATPIPRTMALTLYGDLDISTIKTMPPGRKPVRTVWRKDDARDKVFQFVREEVAGGGQVYVIYPLVEKSEQLDLKNVEDAYEELRMGMLRGLPVAMVHGRVKPKERDEILQRFRNGEVKVLLATTVIEVGIDNPNATMLIIEHAERFGLAQLHQLRGRVGRGGEPATVVGLTGRHVNDVAKQRLEYFCQHTDGFEIAEADLKLRGPGEIFGVRQSGLPEVRIADLWKDQDLLEGARDLSQRLINQTADLDSAHRSLYTYLQESAQARRVLLGGG